MVNNYFLPFLAVVFFVAFACAVNGDQINYEENSTSVVNMTAPLNETTNISTVNQSENQSVERLLSSPRSFSATVSDCTTISSPGYYQLTANIPKHASTCFIITSDDVILDCAGWSVEGDTASSSTSYGVNSTRNDNITISNCTFSDFDSLIYSINSSHVIVFNSTLSDADHAIDFINVRTSWIFLNTITSASVSAINIDESKNMTILNNSISSSTSTAISLSNTDNTTIYSNSIIDATVNGVHLLYSSNNSILNNTITGSNTGVSLFYSPSTTVRNNTILNSAYRSFYEQANSNYNCSVFSNNIGLAGKKIGYFTGLTGSSFGDFNNNYSELVFCNVNDSSIYDITLSNPSKTEALYLINSYNNNLVNITLSNLYTPISLQNSNYNTLSNISSSNLEYGFQVSNSNSTEFSELSVINSSNYGFSLQGSTSNKFYNVTITNVTQGIVLSESLLATVKDCVISNASTHGMYIHYSSSLQVVNTTASGQYALYATASSLFSASNSTFSGTTRDVSVYGDALVPFIPIYYTFLNVTYDTEAVDNSAELTRQWYVRANITRTDTGAPLLGANVTFYNVSDDKTHSQLTNADGITSWMTLTSYKNLSGNTHPWTDYTAAVTYSPTAVETFSVDGNRVLSISLDFGGGSHSCAKEWECTDWSECVGGTQTRECKCDCLSDSDCYGDNDESRSCGFCESDSDCDDNDPCTRDTCKAGECTHENLCECSSASDCDDGDDCTLDSCVYGSCMSQFSYLFCECESTKDCPEGVCIDGNCVLADCDSDLECEDGDPCTLDSCVYGSCMSQFSYLFCECETNSDCPEGVCIDGECVSGCESDSDCDDSNVCTIDSCIDGVCQSFDADGFACSTEDCSTAYCEAGLCVEDSNHCGDYDCNKVWNCSDWSECTDGLMIRDCECVCGYCGTDPLLTKSCEEKDPLVIYTDKEDFTEDESVTIKILDEDGNEVEAYLQITDPSGQSYTILTSNYVLTPDVTGDWKLTAVRSDYLPARRLLDVLMRFQGEDEDKDKFVLFDDSKCCIFNIYGPRFLLCWYWWILIALIIAFAVGYKYRKNKIEEEVEIV